MKHRVQQINGSLCTVVSFHAVTARCSPRGSCLGALTNGTTFCSCSRSYSSNGGNVTWAFRIHPMFGLAVVPQRQLRKALRISEAQAAVRAIPIRQVLPGLLKLVEAKDDQISLWMIDLSGKFRIQLLKWHSAEDFQQLGIAGFEVLGTNAAPQLKNWQSFLTKKFTLSPPSDVWSLSASPPNRAFAGHSPIRIRAFGNGAWIIWQR